MSSIIRLTIPQYSRGSVELKGFCEICWEEVGETTCRLCGRLVCREHVRGGVCEACRTCLCELCGTSLSTGYCIVCGRLVCEKCSVELGVARVCVDCYAKETS